MAKRPDIRTREGLARRLGKKPREVAIAVAARAALRIVPNWKRFLSSRVIKNQESSEAYILSFFRCGAVSWVAALASNGETAIAAIAAARSGTANAAAIDHAAPRPTYAAFAFSEPALAYAAVIPAARAATRTSATYSSAAYASDVAARAAAVFASANADPAPSAADTAASAIDAYDAAYTDMWQAVSDDVGLFDVYPFDKALQGPLWRNVRFRGNGASSIGKPPPAWIEAAWFEFRTELLARGAHWRIWVEWYEAILNGYAPWNLSREVGNQLLLEALTWPDQKWDRPAAEVNADIQALIDAVRERVAGEEVPEQRVAPVRVEERDGKVAKVSDSDSPLAALERDFEQWREPVRDHITELLAGDFKPGTNHGRMRDRLTGMQAHLQGSIADVKENQFRLGYEIDRFGGLVAAYEEGGDDVPVLSPDALKDIVVLNAGIRMGLGKLERWVEFRANAISDQSGVATASPEQVIEALEEMAAPMERQPQYFDPQLPRSFRWLAEALKDPAGASKVAIYGAVRSVENLMIFLAQRALGIGKAALEAVEKHISKAIAAGLITLFIDVALKLSTLPGLSWIATALKAIAKTSL